MNAHQWLELALYLGALILVTKPLGLYLGRVFDANGKTFLDPIFRPLEKLTYWIFRVDPAKEQGWKQYTFAMLIFSLVSLLFTYAILRLQNFLPLNPQNFPALVAASRVQHRRQLHDEHQLAELRRRIHDVVSLADGRADHPQLFFRRRRHGGRGGARARHRAAHGHDHRQFLGGRDAHHLLFAAAVLPRVRDFSRVAGHDSKFQTLHDGEIDRTANHFRPEYRCERQTASWMPRAIR